jgi:5-formyltetrahydrofolate cyclo-ligase
MTGKYSEADASGTPPCLLHELDGNGVPVDPVQAQDVARWRKAERVRLLAARTALSADYRTTQTQAIVRELDSLVPLSAGTIVSVYWPIRAEPDLRSWMKTLCERGLRVALPVALALGRPLVFREWQPQAPLTRGLWQIPYPADGKEVIPTVVLAPLVGFDAECFRLGYGGGFFDRTLVTLVPRPRVIGVGFPSTRIPTVFPQPHDVPMDLIVTGDGVPQSRSASASG